MTRHSVPRQPLFFSRLFCGISAAKQIGMEFHCCDSGASRAGETRIITQYLQCCLSPRNMVVSRVNREWVVTWWGISAQQKRKQSHESILCINLLFRYFAGGFAVAAWRAGKTQQRVPAQTNSLQLSLSILKTDEGVQRLGCVWSLTPSVCGNHAKALQLKQRNTKWFITATCVHLPHRRPPVLKVIHTAAQQRQSPYTAGVVLAHPPCASAKSTRYFSSTTQFWFCHQTMLSACTEPTVWTPSVYDHQNTRHKPPRAVPSATSWWWRENPSVRLRQSARDAAHELADGQDLCPTWRCPGWTELNIHAYDTPHQVSSWQKQLFYRDICSDNSSTYGGLTVVVMRAAGLHLRPTRQYSCTANRRHPSQRSSPLQQKHQSPEHDLSDTRRMSVFCITVCGARSPQTCKGAFRTRTQTFQAPPNHFYWTHHTVKRLLHRERFLHTRYIPEKTEK